MTLSGTWEAYMGSLNDGHAHDRTINTVKEIQMPKSNKKADKHRGRTPYPKPRIFDPPPGFTPSCPNPAWSAHPLTLYEQSQSLRDFLRDLRNGVTGPPDGHTVDPEQSALAEVRCGEADGAGDGSGTGIGGRIMESGPPESPGEDLDFTWVMEYPEDRSKTLKLGGGIDKKVVDEPNKESQNTPEDKGQDSNKASPVVSIDSDGLLVFEPAPQEPISPPKTPDKHKPPPPNLDPIIFSTAWERDLAQQLKKYNDNTPWPVTLGEQLSPAPAWHAECPEGYEPIPCAGFPLERRQRQLWLPAGHDPSIERDESGHYCLDLPDWDRCVMGKCSGCEICRPGYRG
ncbi:hypothetical protein E4T43_05114 [Aureobasidium subglaciale]|nr:hypothetical protein E4T43_05114 [Aureobasidium subglaciale]